MKLFTVLSISTLFFGSVFSANSQLDLPASTDQDRASDMVVADSTPSVDAPAESVDDIDTDDNSIPTDNSQEVLAYSSRSNSTNNNEVPLDTSEQDQNSSFGTHEPVN